MNVEENEYIPYKVNKQFWDGDKFVPITLYRFKGNPSLTQEDWLKATAGQRGKYAQGKYWDFSLTGNYTIMDEKLYTWYQLKWK